MTTLITDEQTNNKIDFNQLRIEHLNKEEEVELKKLLCQFPNIFHKETDYHSQTKLNILSPRQTKSQFIQDHLNTPNARK